MKGLTLTQREQARLQVLNQVLERRLVVWQAALVLGLSERQVWRILAAYRREGAAALAHGNRGKKPANAIPEEIKRQALELVQGRYAGVNHSHLTELVEEREGIRLSRSTVRRILTQAGMKSTRRRRPPKHRCRRERYPQEGMLLQVDGSRHDWLEGRGPYLSLLAAIDDATGTVPYAIFREQEDAQGYFLLLREIIRSQGIPLALYTDRHGIFQSSPREKETLEEQLAGEREPTQFGRALKELGIQNILAFSPQAKGRIERLAGTFQGRLVAELRLAGATTLEEVNRVLWAFLPRFNARFGVPPAQEGTAYRQAEPKLCLDGLLCFKYQRRVARDNTVRLNGHSLQLLPGLDRLSYAHAQVEVQERLDGSLVVVYQSQTISSQEAPPHPVTLRARGGVRGASLPTGRVAGVGPDSKRPQECGRAEQGHEEAPHQAGQRHSFPKPSPDHPWRKPLLTKPLNI